MRSMIAGPDLLSLPHEHYIDVSYIHIHNAVVLVLDYSSSMLAYLTSIMHSYLRRIDVAYHHQTFFQEMFAQCPNRSIIRVGDHVGERECAIPPRHHSFETPRQRLFGLSSDKHCTHRAGRESVRPLCGPSLGCPEVDFDETTAADFYLDS